MNIWTEATDWQAEWECIKPLPSGAQGKALKVRNRKSGTIAFLKVQQREQSTERRARFFREATAYATLEHPGVPRLLQSNAFRYLDKSHELFVATDFIDGPNVRKAVDQYGPLGFDEAAASLKKLLEILVCCHAQDQLHRDIKPENIIFRHGTASDPVLVDFGMSYRLPSDADADADEHFATEHGQEIGNRFVRLPELSADSAQKRDVRSDVAHLGGIFLYLLTGRTPRNLLDAEGSLPHQRADSVARLRTSFGPRHRYLFDFFDRCLAHRLSDRFTSAAVMKEDLAQLVLEHRRQGMDDVNDLKKLVESINTDASQRLVAAKKLYDRALEAIRAVHSRVAQAVLPAYQGFSAGHSNTAAGLRVALGFSHFADINHRYAPVFEFKLMGNELVITLDGEPFHRTEAESPTFDAAFERAVEVRFISGIKRLVDSCATRL